MARILMFGGSGFIGTYLQDFFHQKKDNVQVVSRKKDENSIFWDPEHELFELEKFENYDVFINLSGAGIADLAWTENYKKILINSRIKSTFCIQKIIEKLQHPPELWINISAAGFYGNTLEICTEKSLKGQGFLADLVEQWEAQAQSSKTRVVIPRLPVVLAENGGFLAKTLMLYRLGFAPIFGSGQQLFSWIYLTELAEIFNFFIHEKLCSGIVNLVLEEPLTQAEFSKKMVKKINKKWSIPLKIPDFFLKLIFGQEKAEALFLFGQGIRSERLKKDKKDEYVLTD